MKRWCQISVFFGRRCTGSVGQSRSCGSVWLSPLKRREQASQVQSRSAREGRRAGHPPRVESAAARPATVLPSQELSPPLWCSVRYTSDQERSCTRPLSRIRARCSNQRSPLREEEEKSEEGASERAVSSASFLRPAASMRVASVGAQAHLLPRSSENFLAIPHVGVRCDRRRHNGVGREGSGHGWGCCFLWVSGLGREVELWLRTGASGEAGGRRSLRVWG